MNSFIHGYKTRQTGQIDVKVELINNIVHLDYADDGIGLSSEGVSHIFEPFYTTTRGSGGSGLGAHIVFYLVTQLLKGSIKVNHDLQSGLGFHIVVPVLEDNLNN